MSFKHEFRTIGPATGNLAILCHMEKVILRLIVAYVSMKGYLLLSL